MDLPKAGNGQLTVTADPWPYALWSTSLVIIVPIGVVPVAGILL